MTSASTKSRTVRRMSRCCSESPSVSVRRRIPPFSTSPLQLSQDGGSLGVLGCSQRSTILRHASRRLAEDGVRVGAEDRGWCWSLWRAWLGQWGACGQDPANPWLVDEADQGVGERLRGRGEFRERAIPLPQYRGARQCPGDLAGCVVGEP